MKARIAKSGKYLRVYYTLKGKKIGEYIPIGDDFEAAKKKAEDLRDRMQKDVLNYGHYSQLNKREKEDLATARILLRNTGVSLTDVARFYISSFESTNKKHITWRELVAQFLDTKQHRAKSTQDWYSIRLNRTIKRFGNIPINQLDVDTVTDWINCLGNQPETSRGYLQAINAAFLYATRKDQNLIKENPFEFAAEKIPQTQHRIKSILSPQQGHLLLWAVADHWKAAFALRYFTGLRVQTLAKTDWEQIDSSQKLITVHPFADKKGEERFLTDIPPSFWEWHKRHAPDKGPVISSINSFNAARRSAWTRLEAINRAFEFPSIAMRRSFASYAIHTLGLTQTILTMCHKGEPDTFWNKYYRRSTPKVAEAYLDILPDADCFTKWDNELKQCSKCQEPNFKRALNQWRPRFILGTSN